MIEILNKLKIWFDDKELGEDRKIANRSQYADNITWKELYQIYQWLEEWRKAGR